MRVGLQYLHVEVAYITILFADDNVEGPTCRGYVDISYDIAVSQYTGFAVWCHHAVSPCVLVSIVNVWCDHVSTRQSALNPTT